MSEQICHVCEHEEVCCDSEKYCCDKCKHYLNERPHGNWEYLKEHIAEIRDADGELNQKQTCKFILNLMGVIEKEGEVE